MKYEVNANWYQNALNSPDHLEHAVYMADKSLKQAEEDLKGLNDRMKDAEKIVKDEDYFNSKQKQLNKDRKEFAQIYDSYVNELKEHVKRFQKGYDFELKLKTYPISLDADCLDARLYRKVLESLPNEIKNKKLWIYLLNKVKEELAEALESLG